ncbi:MAG TPA: response regulator, partial [Gemmatimonadaceae bacterium]|nr:response regulator [Gemmatimonadaceae bacterium]
ISAEVTERRAEERHAAESHALVQAVLNSTSYLIVAVDNSGTITGLNPAAAEALGTTEEAAVGRMSIEPLFDDSAFSSIVRAADRTGRDDREWSLRRHDGREFPAFVSISVLLDASRQRTGYAIVSTDITTRKEAEVALRRATHEAEQASRAKGEFLANMSHEIRTPMNAVIGLTGLLLDTSLGEEQLEFVETIRASGDALLTIINDILDFSKIESGNLVLEAESFDVRDCVESALDLVAGRAAEKDVNLAYLVEDSLPQSIVGDVTRVRQVMVNFLSNAVKFTEKGDVFVHVTSRELPNGRLEAAFSVRDTGIGIPSDRIDRLFRSFSQVDASTTRQFGGTGLGLAISKRLVELMGGEVGVESTPGEGSTFRFTIDVAAGEVTRRTFLGGVAPELSSRRVLLVDDNATNRRILEQHLRGWGMHVVVATSGAEALSMIKHEGAFDCAVFDMQMPSMDGEALAEAWRAEQASLTAVPPLILATSMGRRGSVGEKSFAAVLSKPVKPSLLYDTLVSIFTGTSHRRSRSVARIIDRTTAVRQPLRILLVEDNPVNQMVATRMCEKLGYRIDVAGNGLEALAAVNHIPYDTLLMDVHMPEMDGLEATRRIREFVPKDRNPWIIAMTASAMESDRQACVAAGMDDYTPKPVTMESLEGALTRAWVAKGSPAALATTSEHAIKRT